MGNCCSSMPYDPNQEQQQPQNQRQRNDVPIRRRNQHGGLDLDQHDTDLSKPWDEKFKDVTFKQLQQLRTQFWETRVGGSPEAWQTLRMAAEAEDGATARMIRQAAGLTEYERDSVHYCHCYDESGFRYDVPMYVLNIPRSLTHGRIPGADEDAGGALPASPENKEQLEQEIAIKLRLSTGEDLDIETRCGDTILGIKKYVERERGYPSELSRVLYCGRLLRDNDNLIVAGIQDKTLVQIMVRRPPPPTTS